eukprot:1059336-Alexandrium_andersonii.AAC.1
MPRATRRCSIAPSVRKRPRFRRPEIWHPARPERSEEREVSEHIATNPAPRSRTQRAEASP